MNFIGKVLFPRQPPWRARRQAKHMVAAFLVSLVLGAIVVAIMYIENAKR
jgi:hypothetical protein